MRNKKASILTIVVLMVIIVVCIMFLSKDHSATQKEETNIGTDVTEQVEAKDEDIPADTISENVESQPLQSVPKKQLVDVLIKYTSTNLNIRALPQHDSDLVGVIENFYTQLYYYGETAQGYGSDNIMHTWYRINADSGVSGWVRSDLVVSQNANIKYPYESDNAGSDYVKFTDDTINIRSEPTYNSALVGKITDCNTYLHHCFPGTGYEMGLGSDGQQHGWIKVIVNSNLQGWVRDDLVIETSAEVWYGNVFVKNSSLPLNVRALPQHNSALVVSIQNADTKLYYRDICKSGLGSDGLMHDWYEVDISSTERGWVRSDLVKPATLY